MTVSITTDGSPHAVLKQPIRASGTGENRTLTDRVQTGCTPVMLQSHNAGLIAGAQRPHRLEETGGFAPPHGSGCNRPPYCLGYVSMSAGIPFFAATCYRFQRSHIEFQFGVVRNPLRCWSGGVGLSRRASSRAREDSGIRTRAVGLEGRYATGYAISSCACLSKLSAPVVVHGLIPVRSRAVVRATVPFHCREALVRFLPLVYKLPCATKYR